MRMRTIALTMLGAWPIATLSANASWGQATLPTAAATAPTTLPAALGADSPQTRPTTQPAAERPAHLAPSKVVAVTVYRGSALVTREVQVKGGPGTVELVIPDLPPATASNSLYTEGAQQIRILSTRYRTRAVAEDTREAVRQVQDQIHHSEMQTQLLERQVKVLTENTEFIGKLENFTNVTLKELTDKGMLNSDATLKLAQYIMDQRSEKATTQVQLQQQIAALAEQSAFLQRQLAELTRSINREERDAVITVDKTDGAPGSVRLNYLVSAATWRPLYKLRATTNGQAEAVNLEYLAEIVQQSGEDWAGVDVVLSTAEPMLNAAPPELLALDVTVAGRSPTANQAPAAQQQELYLNNRQEGQALRKRGAEELNKQQDRMGWESFNEAAAREQTNELLVTEKAKLEAEALSAADRQGPSVTFHLKTRLTIPNRNDPQLIEVSRSDLQPTFFFRAVPVLTPHVYRLAMLTNKTDLVLLPGEATMYVGSDFVGRMNLPLVAIGEQFTAGFGVDPQIQVSRVQVSRASNVQGGNQVQTFDYRIRIESFKNAEVSLQVLDRLPRGESESVGVALVKTSPEISTDPAYLRDERRKNLLRWDLKVPAQSNGDKALSVDYQFKLEYAKDVALGNFKSSK